MTTGQAGGTAGPRLRWLEGMAAGGGCRQGWRVAGRIGPAGELSGLEVLRSR